MGCLVQVTKEKDDRCPGSQKKSFSPRIMEGSKKEELIVEAVGTLIDRIEVDSYNHVTVILRYRDEYHTLLQLLQDSGEAALV